jgi:ubiquinone/menaquinone biosynthesis C-methylase UbiE
MSVNNPNLRNGGSNSDHSGNKTNDPLKSLPPLIRVWYGAVKFAYRLLYNEFAWTYDLVSWTVSLGEWRSWQRAALKHLNVPRGSRILEIAHGTANFQIDLRTAGLESVAMDLSPYMGGIARRKLMRHRLPANLVRAKAQELPFPAGSFPAAVTTFPTEFIIDPATLRDIHRVLVPGGRLVIVLNGVLTGGGAARTGVELAYRAAGQRTGVIVEYQERLRTRFEAAGFTLTQHDEPCRISVAQVLVAEKRS